MQHDTQFQPKKIQINPRSKTNIYFNSGLGETSCDRSIQLVKAEVETTMVKAKMRPVNRLSDFISPNSQLIYDSLSVKE